MDLRNYLTRTAEDITARTEQQLPPTDGWTDWAAARRRDYLTAMGIAAHLDRPRTPLNVRVTQRHERAEYDLECLTFESLPGLSVAGNLYVPRQGSAPRPAILYLCGHDEDQKFHYQDHARRYAQLGFVTLILDSVQLGETRGYHHGTRRQGTFNWVSRGYTPAAVEVWNGIRALDLLSGRTDVDGSRLGVTGISGGGAATWWLAAADERVRAASPSCSTGTMASHVRERTLDDHCDCMFPANPWGWSLMDMASLVAPRRLLVSSATRDVLYRAEDIDDAVRLLRSAYLRADAPDHLSYFTYESPHAYQPASRRHTFRWFVEHLQGRVLRDEDLADVDDVREDHDALRVFTDGPPPNDRSTTVQHWFVERAEVPTIRDEKEVVAERARVVDQLRRQTFATFPSPVPEPRCTTVMTSTEADSGKLLTFTYEPEPRVLLDGALRIPSGDVGDTPVIIELLGATSDRVTPDYAAPQSALSHGVPRHWARATIAPRGTACTAWARPLEPHLRRAAVLTGRTVASLRVLDTLQGLAAVRQLQESTSAPIVLAGRGEMAAVVLYAALLDGQVDGVVLADVPATQDAPDPAGGDPELIEMLGCLRITDLPQVAGLLWPAELVFVGPRPASFGWAEDLYRRLGPPGARFDVPELRFWKPMMSRTTERTPAATGRR